MWHVSYYDAFVSPTTLPAQLRIYTRNCIAKYVHPNTVVKINSKAFLHLHGMDSRPTNAKQVHCSIFDFLSVQLIKHKGNALFCQNF